MEVPQEYTACTNKLNLQVKSTVSVLASVSYPHHHHRHVVCRAPLHCLVSQPVACSFIAGINSRLPFSGLDLVILPKGWDLSKRHQPVPSTGWQDSDR